MRSHVSQFFWGAKINTLIKNLYGKAIECLPLVHTYAEAEEVNSKWGGGPLVLYESGGAQ